MSKDKAKILLSASLFLLAIIWLTYFIQSGSILSFFNPERQVASVSGILQTIYVDDDASDDSGDGSEGKPFKTIQKAVDVATPGTRILVKAGIYNENVVFKSSGNASAPIVLEGERPGNEYLTIMDGGKHMSGWQPAPEIASGVYKIELSWKPVHITVGEYRAGMPLNVSGSGSEEEGVNGTQFGGDPMNVLKDLNFSLRNPYGNGVMVNLWDLSNAMGVYSNGYLYLRTKDNADPNSLDIKLVPPGFGILIQGKSYIEVRNLKLRGFVRSLGIIDGSNNNLVENNLFLNGSENVYLGNKADNNVVRYNETNLMNLGARPGSWSGGTDIDADLKQGLYRFYKVYANSGQGFNQGSDNAGILINGGNDNQIYENYLHDGIIGVYIQGTAGINNGNKIFRNRLENFSSVGLGVSLGSNNTEIYENRVHNANYNIRFQFVNRLPTSKNTYVYKNRFSQLNGVGNQIYFHIVNGNNVDPLYTLYVYNNTFTGSHLGVNIDAYAGDKGGIPGTFWFNNIFSNKRGFEPSGISPKGVNLFNMVNAVGALDFNWIGVESKSAMNSQKTAVWMGEHNNIERAYIWEFSSIPDFVVPNDSKAIGTGLDVSVPFIINGKSLNAMPGIEPCPYNVSMGINYCDPRGGVKSQEITTPTPTPLNALCSQTPDTCTQGTLSNQSDSSTHYLWQCLGSNGGTTATCSINKSINQPNNPTPTPSVLSPTPTPPPTLSTPTPKPNNQVNTNTLRNTVATTPTPRPNTPTTQLTTTQNTPTTPINTLNQDLTMSLGSSGSNVTLFQKALVDENLLTPTQVTGIYDKSTENAVKSFQTKYNIVPPTDPDYGKVDPRTVVVYLMLSFWHLVR